MHKPLAFVLVLALLIPFVTLSQSTFIKAGKLVDPKSGSVLANQMIMIEGSKIKAVGPNLAVPKGATVLDLSAYTILPGLIDCHTHILLQPENDLRSCSLHRFLYEKMCHQARKPI